MEPVSCNLIAKTLQRRLLWRIAAPGAACITVPLCMQSLVSWDGCPVQISPFLIPTCAFTALFCRQCCRRLQVVHHESSAVPVFWTTLSAEVECITVPVMHSHAPVTPGRAPATAAPARHGTAPARWRRRRRRCHAAVAAPCGPPAPG